MTKVTVTRVYCSPGGNFKGLETIELILDEKTLRGRPAPGHE